MGLQFSSCNVFHFYIWFFLKRKILLIFQSQYEGKHANEFLALHKSYESKYCNIIPVLFTDDVTVPESLKSLPSLRYQDNDSFWRELNSRTYSASYLCCIVKRKRGTYCKNQIWLKNKLARGYKMWNEHQYMHSYIPYDYFYVLSPQPTNLAEGERRYEKDVMRKML